MLKSEPLNKKKPFDTIQKYIRKIGELFQSFIVSLVLPFFREIASLFFPMPEVLLSATELCFRIDLREVLKDATLTIHEGDRIGLVGANGSGKSTFLKIIAGNVVPDTGTVARSKNLALGYLPQDFTLDPELTVQESIEGGAEEILALITQYETLAHDDPKAADVEHRIQHLDGWNLEARIKSLMTSLRTPEGNRKIETLSGGEKRRVALCRALVGQPDLLILDEPTNHLDTESTEWIEDFLAGYRGACLLVTHDRYFLDRVTNRIVELFAGSFFSHNGNYSDFLVAKAERMLTEESQEQGRQRFLKRELDWVRRAPKARTTKSKSRVDRYFEALDKAPPQREQDMDLVIPPPPKLGNRVVELRDVGIALGGKSLFSGLNLNYQPGMRLGVVGRNGLGKSTLLKLILGEIEPDSGIVERGPQTQINYIDQARLLLKEDHTVFEEVGQGGEWVQLGAEKLSLRSYLKRFLFTDERINTKVSQLSGGERSRLVLARILKSGGNFLILDEPTNDLDLPTLRVLEEALATFKGCVLVVSHDRYFLNRVCTGILAFEGEGQVVYSVGSYDYYAEKRRDRVTAKAAKASAPEPAALPVPAKSVKAGKLSYKEQRELEMMEASIHSAEENVSEREAKFQDPKYLIELGSQINTATAELESARQKVKLLYARWEELEKVRAGLEKS